MSDQLIVEVAAANVLVGDAVAGTHFWGAQTAPLMVIERIDPSPDGETLRFWSQRRYFYAGPTEQIAVSRTVHGPGDPIDSRPIPTPWPAGMTYDHKGTAELLLRRSEGRSDPMSRLDIERAHVHAILATIPIPPQIYVDIKEPS